MIFRILFAASFILTITSVALYRRQAQQGQHFSTEEEGRAIAVPLRVAGALMWLYPFFYILAPRPWVTWSTVDAPDVARWLGVVVAFLVLPVALWTQRSLGDNVTTTVITREEHELVTAGPYRWIRHPLYTLSLIYFGSLALVAASWFLLVVSTMTFVMVAVRTPIEEEKLIQRFGNEYKAYMKRTGRFLPRLGSRANRN